jgi:hypothetical protein
MQGVKSVNPTGCIGARDHDPKCIGTRGRTTDMLNSEKT